MEVYPILNIYLEALLRTLLSVAVLFVLARIDGAKQVSQLTFYDYIVGITAGSIAASMCIESDIDIWVCLIAVVLFMLSSMLFSVLSIQKHFSAPRTYGSVYFSHRQGRGSVTTACAALASI